MNVIRSYRLPILTSPLHVIRPFSGSSSWRTHVAPDCFDGTLPEKFRRPGRAWAEPLDENTRLSYHPLYIGSSSEHVALTNRVNVGVFFFGLYVSHYLAAIESVGGIWSLLAIVVFSLPPPICGWLTRPYVTAIFRLHRSDEEQTYENLVKDETLIVQRIGFLGRSLYATQVKVRDLKVVNKRFGWVNWTCTDPESGEVIKMYVADNVGGMKLDRIWGIAERNSGVNNGRDIYDRKEVDDK